MIRTGIFGGSFNPIHKGHISLARQLRQKAGLDEVWLMVSPQNPLKASTDLLDDEIRMQMARLAVEAKKASWPATTRCICPNHRTLGTRFNRLRRIILIVSLC